MLYAPGLEPYDPNKAQKAIFIPFAQVPQPAGYSSMAICHLSLAERLRDLGVKGERRFRKLEGGWSQIKGISLQSGRFAFVQEFEHHPGDVHLYLATWREIHIYRQDFFAARELLSLSDEQIERCDGPYLWR
jgi:hypothetical protein